jgi:hypothetical protein
LRSGAYIRAWAACAAAAWLPGGKWSDWRSWRSICGLMCAICAALSCAA